MADLATLQIKVDASGAIRNTERLSGALENVAGQGPLVSAALGKTEAQIRKLQTAEIAAYREADRMAQSLNKVEQELKDVSRETESAAQKMKALDVSGRRVGTMLGSTLVAGLALVVKETVDGQREQAQLAAALRSTAGASGQTIDSLNNQAAALRSLTAATGGEIAGAQALLLTFTKIGGDVFPKATAMTLDMAQALGTDARGAAMQLGKALNDPILGVSALGRAGVQFSADQKAMIASLVETNKTAEAQKIILAELETQVGGSAAAYRNTLGGALDAVKESFLELFEVTSPGMTGLVDHFNELADTISIIPVGLELAFEKIKNVMLRFEAFFDLSGGDPTKGPLAAIARLEGREQPLTPQQQLDASNNTIAALKTLQEELLLGIARANQSRLEAAKKGNRGLSPLADSSSGSVKDATKQFEELLVSLERSAVVGDALRLNQLKKEQAFRDAIAALEDAHYADSAKRLKDKFDADDEAAAAVAGVVEQHYKDAREAFMNRQDALQAEKDLRENLQMELARNFRENMQRAFGDVLTEFVTKGKVSIGGLFDSLKQMGGSMVGQGIGKMLSGSLLTKMTPFGSLFAGGALALVGNLFGRRRRPNAGQDNNQQARFEANEAARLEREQEMRDFVAGRNGGRGGVIQSVGQVLQETSASRMIGELVAIRVATTRTADAVAGGTFTGGAGTTVNVTVQGGAAGNLNGVAEQVADAVDRLLGTRVQGLRLTSGSAVTI